MPERIQLRRTKGWRKPDGAIVVARPSRWGNQALTFTWRHSATVSLPLYVYPAGISVAMGKPSKAFVVNPDGSRVEYFDNAVQARRFAVEWFRRVQAPTMDLRALRGHDLACWCPLDQPCHADVLLELANPAAGSEATENER